MKKVLFDDVHAGDRVIRAMAGANSALKIISKTENSVKIRIEQLPVPRTPEERHLMKFMAAQNKTGIVYSRKQFDEGEFYFAESGGQ